MLTKAVGPNCQITLAVDGEAEVVTFAELEKMVRDRRSAVGTAQSLPYVVADPDPLVKSDVDVVTDEALDAEAMASFMAPICSTHICEETQNIEDEGRV